MLTDDDPDLPVTKNGFVRTFLYPCDFYELPELRMRALSDFALESGTLHYYLKLLRDSPLMNETKGDDLSIESIVPPSEEGMADFESLIKHEWDQRSDEVWWVGDWTHHESALDHSDFLEHILLDEAGQWAVLLSPEDHGYLIGDPNTSRAILSAWKTTPRDEIDRYLSNMNGEDNAASDQADKILNHAVAGLWT